tara:strand:+ start:303 stop:536 length:234 start_codon:yes stop_codon:yes gene_type:complete
MKKAEKILEKHIVLNDCIGYLGRDGRLYKAIIDAMEEAINYTHCSTELLFTTDEIIDRINEQTVLDGETFRNYFDKK